MPGFFGVRRKPKDRSQVATQHVLQVIALGEQG